MSREQTKTAGEGRKLLRGRSRNWPPYQPIAPEGRIGGYTTSICLLVVGVAYSIIGITSVGCTHSCIVSPGLAGVLLLLFVPVIALAIWGIQNVARRTVDPGGFAAWRFGLCFLFVLGIGAVVSRIPNATCAAGFHLVRSDFQYRCLNPGSSEHDPTSWSWLKDTIMLGALVVGVWVIPKRSIIRATSVVTACVWFIGAVLLALPWFAQSTSAAQSIFGIPIRTGIP